MEISNKNKLNNLLLPSKISTSLSIIDMGEYPGLIIIGTEKELNQLPLEMQSLIHNIFERKSDGTVIIKKWRNLPCKTTTNDNFYIDEEGFGRVPQKDGKHRKDDPYTIWE